MKEKCCLCNKIKVNNRPELVFVCDDCIKIVKFIKSGKEYKEASDMWERKHKKKV